MSTRSRHGMTIMETAVALAILATASVLAAQLATWSLFERVRSNERLAAIECAANVMEAARARSLSDLSPEWARDQRIPAELAAQLREPSLAVRVEPIGRDEQSRPNATLPSGMKRVSVELQWKHRDGTRARAVELTGWFADRASGGES